MKKRKKERKKRKREKERKKLQVIAFVPRIFLAYVKYVFRI